MPDFFQYYGQFQSVRGRFGGLPPWARSIVALFALPGILLAVLALMLFLVSILALFLLTAPVYRLLRAVTGSRMPVAPAPARGEVFANPLTGGGFLDPQPPSGRKSVQVRVVE